VRIASSQPQEGGRVVLAKLNGATAAEIEDAVHFAKSSAGWSTYITGMGTDDEQFKQQVLAACEHARQHAAR
jgi:hypothetical protein